MGPEDKPYKDNEKLDSCIWAEIPPLNAQSPNHFERLSPEIRRLLGEDIPTTTDNNIEPNDPSPHSDEELSDVEYMYNDLPDIVKSDSEDDDDSEDYEMEDVSKQVPLSS